MKQQNFFSEQEEQDIIASIVQAEAKTSGEIRVHIEAVSIDKALTRAQSVFMELNMEKTLHRNGILFYLNTKSKEFAVIGDSGINNVVPANFWDTIKNEVIHDFKQGAFSLGIIKGILQAGEQLRVFFPATANDVNELPNQISSYE